MRNRLLLYLLPLLALLLASCAPVERLAGGRLAPTAAATGAATIHPTGAATATQEPTAPLTPDPSPTALPSSTPEGCLDAQGRVEQQEILSTTLNRSLVVRVYLPPCYDPRREPGYPAAYLLHGQSMDASAWEGFGAAVAADRLMAGGEVPPFILVMPQEAYYLEDVRESGFGGAVMADLIPWVDATYNTCPERGCRAIGGISRGATWAVLLGLQYPGEFAAIGAHSLPSPPMSSSRLRSLVEAAPGGPPALRIDIGSADPYYDGAARFEASLQLLEVPHEWLVEEGTHDAAYWTGHMESYLRWYGERLRNSQ